MSKLLEKSRYLAIIGVLGLLVAALAAFAWGMFQTVQTVLLIVQSLGADKGITVALLQIVDSVLLATTLLIFSVSLYELFIAEVAVPEWMVAHNLHDLKTKLSSMIVMVMAVKFVEKLVDVKDYGDVLSFGAAVTLVSGALIAFGYFGHKE
jgi:uncharacterized protein (TIGR00645 family)